MKKKARHKQLAGLFVCLFQGVRSKAAGAVKLTATFLNGYVSGR